MGAWVEVHSPRDEGELVLLESLLDGEGIPYVVRNDRFGALYVGPPVDLYNTRQSLVRRDDHDRARELISDYLRTVRAGGPPPRSGPGWTGSGSWRRAYCSAGSSRDARDGGEGPVTRRDAGAPPRIARARNDLLFDAKNRARV